MMREYLIFKLQNKFDLISLILPNLQKFFLGTLLDKNQSKSVPPSQNRHNPHDTTNYTNALSICT